MVIGYYCALKMKISVLGLGGIVDAPMSAIIQISQPLLKPAAYRRSLAKGDKYVGGIDAGVIC